MTVHDGAVTCAGDAHAHTHGWSLCRDACVHCSGGQHREHACVCAQACTPLLHTCSHAGGSGTCMQNSACDLHATAHTCGGLCAACMSHHTHRCECVTCVSWNMHAEVNVAPVCHQCASARMQRQVCQHPHALHIPLMGPPHAPHPWYLYWQEVPLPSWQRCLCRPARWARHSPSASASPSSALSSRAVGRALPPAGEQHVSPRHAHHPPDTRTKPHSLHLPCPSPRSRPAGPLSWLPPTPGLSQVGGAQPCSQWQCPWLLHTWVGDTS